MKVWVLIEEEEIGVNALGTTYVVLSAHTTEESADAAREAWWEDHEKAENYPDEQWCVCDLSTGDCPGGRGVTMDEVELVKGGK